MTVRELCSSVARERRIRAIWASAFQFEDEVDLVFSVAHPNPERRGCPGVADLWELAHGACPLEDARYRHVARCSPCYCEWRGIHQCDPNLVTLSARRAYLRRVQRQSTRG